MAADDCDKCGVVGRELHHHEASGQALCDGCTTLAETANFRYSDTFELDGQFTLADFDDLMERLRERGESDALRNGRGSNRVIGFSVEAPDLWDLAQLVHEVELELQSRGIMYAPEKSKIKEV